VCSRPSTATSWWLPVEWHHFRVTSGHVRSCEVTSCHVTATYCVLQPYRSSNVPKTRVLGLLKPLPADFRSNNITSGWISVTWGHWHHFLSRDCHLLRVTAMLELKHTKNASSRPSTATSFRLPVKWRNFRSPAVTWCHFLSRDYHLLWVAALQELKLTRNASSRPTRHFLLTSGRMTPLPGRLRWREVTFCHVTATSCLLQPCRSPNVPKTQVLGLVWALSADFRSNVVTSGSLPVT